MSNPGGGGANPGPAPGGGGAAAAGPGGNLPPGGFGLEEIGIPGRDYLRKRMCSLLYLSIL